MKTCACTSRQSKHAATAWTQRSGHCHLATRRLQQWALVSTLAATRWNTMSLWNVPRGLGLTPLAGSRWTLPSSCWITSRLHVIIQNARRCAGQALQWRSGCAYIQLRTSRKMPVWHGGANKQTSGLSIPRPSVGTLRRTQEATLDHCRWRKLTPSTNDTTPAPPSVNNKAQCSRCVLYLDLVSRVLTSGNAPPRSTPERLRLGVHLKSCLEPITGILASEATPQNRTS